MCTNRRPFKLYMQQDFLNFPRGEITDFFGFIGYLAETLPVVTPPAVTVTVTLDPPAPGPPCPSPSHGFKFAALASPSLASLSSRTVWLCTGKLASHVSVLLHEAHRGRTVTKKN